MMTIKIIKAFRNILFLILFFLAMPWAYAEPPKNLVNQGYSVVSYFEKNKAEMGQAEFSVEYEGKLYWFASADQVETFNSNPTRYLPIFDAFCPYSLTLGRQVPIDPTNFKIIADQLLLFHLSDESNGLEEWNRSGNEEELLRRARGAFLLLEF
jgi:YHS domain-containing protein